MQTQFSPRLSLVGSLSFILVCSALVYPGKSAQGQDEASAVGPFRTQTIELEAGWNAVYLEVEPLNSNPAALFVGTPIEIVASYFRPISPMEFVESPSKLIVDRENWSVWYAPERDDTLLSNLYAMQAHQSYLLYTEEDYTWTLAGAPLHGSTHWHPNAYSFVGFQIDSSAAPTMENFFAGSDAQSTLKLYRLVDGRWSLVTDPASTLLESGVAYWAYSEGATDFSGPLEVSLATNSIGGLVFSEQAGASRIVIKNVSLYPQNLSFELTAGNAGLLPLSYIVTATNGEDTALEKVSLPLPETFQLGPLEAGQAIALDLQVDQSQVTEPVLSALLTITSDAGVRRQIPIVSIRRDLIEP
jgi:hypothetical protein